ncbi:MAG: hypothetical protein J7L61_03400 [Thermoplasmata archaeon]|nr:hypothetical protein [Thermoplasmata archaeon]
MSEGTEATMLTLLLFILLLSGLIARRRHRHNIKPGVHQIPRRPPIRRVSPHEVVVVAVSEHHPRHPARAASSTSSFCVKR